MVRALATGLALNRIGFGAAFLVAPRLAGTWVGRDVGRQGTQVMVRGLAARDVTLGAGALASLFGGGSARPWFAAHAAADTSDLVATILARDKLPDTAVKFALAMAAGSAAIAAAYVAFGERDADEDEPASPSATADTSDPFSNRSHASATFPSGSST